MGFWKGLLSLFRKDRTIKPEEDRSQEAVFAKHALNPSGNRGNDIVRLHIISAMEHAFSEEERKIILAVAKAFRSYLKGKSLKSGVSVSKDHDETADIILPLSSLSKEDEDLKKLETAMASMHRNIIRYENEGMTRNIAFLARSEINRQRNQVSFSFFREVYEALLTLSTGYREKELKVVKSFRSIYTQMFYDLLKDEEKPVTYSVSELKIRFHLEDKYRGINKFTERVIEKARKELDEKGIFDFSYKLVFEKKCSNPKGGRKRVRAIVFTRKKPKAGKTNKNGKQA